MKLKQIVNKVTFKLFPTILINKFIRDIKVKYPHITIIYYYDDIHWIAHDHLDLEMINEEFAYFVGKLLGKYFYDNDIFNFCFYSNYEMWKQKKNNT